MSELAVTPHLYPVAEYVPSDPTGGRLVAWADGLTAAHRIGAALCETAFVPAHFRGKAAEAAAAILYGDEIGLTPTQSLQNLYVISGKPGLYARTMVALVLAAGHEVWTVSKSDQEVVVAGRRRGSTHVLEERWNRSRAQKAGYTNNRKYDTDPQAMLYARAAADVCRQIAPDALAGLAYSVEELELADEPTTTTTVTRAAARTTTARRAPMPPEPSVALDAPAGDDVAPEPPADPDAVTSAQLKKIGALMREAGIVDRAAALELVSQVVGREITTRSDLTKAEAHRLIEHLEAPPAVEPDVDEDTGEIHDAVVVEEPPLDDDDNGWPPVAQPGSRA